MPKEEKSKGRVYNVTDIASALGIQKASVRVGLRALGEKKRDKSYAWDRQGFDRIVRELKDRGATVPEQLRKGREKQKSNKAAKLKAKKPRSVTPETIETPPEIA